MAMTEAQKRAKKKWDDAHPLDRIQLVVRQGEKDRIKAAADAAGEALNHYMVEATRQRMQREGLLPIEEETEEGAQASPSRT